MCGEEMPGKGRINGEGCEIDIIHYFNLILRRGLEVFLKGYFGTLL